MLLFPPSAPSKASLPDMNCQPSKNISEVSINCTLQTMSCGRVIISGVGPGPVSMTLHDPDDSHGIYDGREPGLTGAANS